MKKSITIDYHWTCDQLDFIPKGHFEALKEDAESRIFSMVKEGYLQGELNTSVRFGKDVVPEEDKEEGLTYSGWWSYLTEDTPTPKEDEPSPNNEDVVYITIPCKKSYDEKGRLKHLTLTYQDTSIKVTDKDNNLRGKIDTGIGLNLYFFIEGQPQLGLYAENFDIWNSYCQAVDREDLMISRKKDSSTDES